MAVLPITLYGDKILRKKVEKVNDIDIKTIELIKDMFETMRNAHGIGLAANQVGADKSIFIIDISVIEGYEDIKPMVFINPEIVESSEEEIEVEEGCLSIPDIRADVLRPKKILIRFQDSDLVQHEMEADELLARVIQHENDHLNGILFIDKLEEGIQKKIKKDLLKIKNRKIDFEYPVTEYLDYQLK